MYKEMHACIERERTYSLTPVVLYARKRANPAKTVAPTAASARTHAGFNMSSGTHVQRLRNATAGKFLELQKAAFDGLPGGGTLILELAWDETSTTAHLDMPNEECSIMTIHVEAMLRQRGEDLAFSIVVPPAIVSSTSASGLLAALDKRLPLNLSRCCAKFDRVILLTNTDSGPACLKVAAHLSSDYLCLPCPCRMHQLCLSMVEIMKLSGMMGSMWCASHLFHKKRCQTMLRKQLSKLLETTFDVEYINAPCVGPNKSRVEALLRLIEPPIKHDEQPSRSKLLQAVRKLAAFLDGDASSERVRHRCRLGCHHSRDAARKDAATFVTQVFLDHPCTVPAWNKWTKIEGPVAWFAAFANIHALLPACMEGILWHEHHMLDRIEEEAELGMNDQDSFLLQEQVRFRRASDWLSCPITPVKLAGIIIPLKIATSILGKLFAGGSRYESGEAKNIMPFVSVPIANLKKF